MSSTPQRNPDFQEDPEPSPFASARDYTPQSAPYVEADGSALGPAVEDRSAWGSKLQFLLATVGYAVGLGNIWRFPYLCYRNGGGAFLIPYFISLFLIGIPLFLLELAIGQFFRRGSIGAWTKISGVFKGIGVASVVVSFVVSLYYNAIIGWSLYYFVVSFQSPLPWVNYTCTGALGHSQPSCTNKDTENFFYGEALQSSAWISDPGPLVWQQVICLLVAWIITFACIAKGVQSSGRVAYFTATFPYVILVILFFRGVTLPGAGKGIEFFIKPQFSRLGDATVWIEAATQIFYSLGLAFGGLIAFASHNPKDNNCVRDALLVAGINCGTSVFGGFVVFSIIGYMAHITGSDVADVVDAGPGLAFIAFPTAVATLPGAPFFAVMFFFMLILLGLDSQFGTIEGVVTAITDRPDMKKYPTWLVSLVICAVSFLAGLIFTCRGGIFFFELFDNYSATLPLITVALLEIVAVSWVYGVDNFLDHIFEMTGKRLGLHWWIVYKFVAPILALVLWVAAVVKSVSTPLSFEHDGIKTQYPAWTVGFGWFLIICSVLWIPLFAVLNRPDRWAARIATWFRTRTWAWLRQQFRRPTTAATRSVEVATGTSMKALEVELDTMPDIDL